jgi:hypothetical protein
VIESRNTILHRIEVAGLYLCLPLGADIFLVEANVSEVTSRGLVIVALILMTIMGKCHGYAQGIESLL